MLLKLLLSAFSKPSDDSTARLEPNENDPFSVLVGKVKGIIKGIFDWLTLILMFVLPAITSDYRIVYGVTFGVGLLLSLYNGYQHFSSIATVKIFPKYFEVNILLINFALFIMEVSAQPSPDWSEDWTGIISNTYLLLAVVLSMLIQKPFTIEFAMEKVDEQYWSNPTFISLNYSITMAWAVEFALSVLFSILGIFVYPDNSAARNVPGIVVLILTLIFTKRYPEYVRAQARKQMAPANDANGAAEMA